VVVVVVVVVVAYKEVARIAEMAMDRMPTAEERHLSVFEVLCLRTVVVAVRGTAAAVAAGVAGPVPAVTVGAREMQQANGGYRCSKIEAWQ